MKRILEQWPGTFKLDGEIKRDLKDWKPKKGEQFKVKLIARRRNEGKRI